MSASDAWRVLVVGGGGREHAIAVSLSRSPSLLAAAAAAGAAAEVLVVPGNAGMPAAATAASALIECVTGADIVALARARRVGFVFVGPEAPLAAGLAGEWRRAWKWQWGGASPLMRRGQGGS